MMLRLLTTALAFLLLAAGLLSTSGLAQGRGRGPAAAPVRPSPYEWVEPTRLGADLAQGLFTAYDAGRYAEFDRLARGLTSYINPFEFEAEAERWMDTAPDRRRRALVVAAVALELASASVREDPMAQSSVDIKRQELEWRKRQTAIHVGFVLAELGCSWLRDHPLSKGEQSWHAAFVALMRARGGPEQVDADVSLRWVRLGRFAPLTLQRREKSLRELDASRQSEHQALMAWLRKQASRVSRSTRVDGARSREHDRHVLARFPESPLPRFREAILREGLRRSVADTLLFESFWIDTAEVDRIANGGGREVRAVPANRRMDKPSAERFLRVVPEPESSLSTTMGTPSAAFTSLILWDIADGFQAVPEGEPVGAERALRLGQTYARLARPDLALPQFARAEALATTPYESYLARLFAGALFTRTARRTEAITAFRGALRAVPRAHSASFALAPLLLQVDEREEAAEILKAAMKLPQADDPLRAYYEGDPAALSRALARLREETTR